MPWHICRYCDAIHKTLCTHAIIQRHIVRKGEWNEGHLFVSYYFVGCIYEQQYKKTSSVSAPPLASPPSSSSAPYVLTHNILVYIHPRLRVEHIKMFANIGTIAKFLFEIRWVVASMCHFYYQLYIPQMRQTAQSCCICIGI